MVLLSLLAFAAVCGVASLIGLIIAVHFILNEQRE